VEVSCGKKSTRRNVFLAFETEGKTNAGFKPLADFQTYLPLLENLMGRWKNNTLPHCKVVMETRILDLKLFLSQGVLFGSKQPHSQLPKALTPLLFFDL
jgi:hypothetical protein